MSAIRKTAAAILLLATLSAGSSLASAQGADLPVDLELVLAVDVSMSMDMSEQRLQREGYVRALKDPEVIQAIAGGINGRIAVTYVEWAGAFYQQTLLPWTVIDGAQAAAALSDRVADLPLGRMHRTSISGALHYSAGLFENNGFEGLRRVVDVSGDGPNNQGDPVTMRRDELVAAGIVINGLAIMTRRSGFGGFFDISKLDQYYETCVIGGPGSFVIPVTDASEFTTAIRRKMILEIAGSPVRLVPAAAAEPVDCLVGERQWQYWMERQE